MGATQGTLRTHAEVSRFFDGLDMVEPGLVQLHRWRPGGTSSAAAPQQVTMVLGRGMARCLVALGRPVRWCGPR
ncbi:MAG TPA: SAM-dependent methyltransferase [Actinomycetes bacterium]|nr:SAM-dependent methyltransferase [Actinomycetes bacterium]